MSDLARILLFGFIGLLLAGPLGAVVAGVLTYFFNKLLKES